MAEAEIGQNEEIRNLQKLWINLELEMEEMNSEASKWNDFLDDEGENGTKTKAKLQVPK